MLLVLLLTFLVLHHSSSCSSQSSIFTPFLALLPCTADSLPSCTVESCHPLLNKCKRGCINKRENAYTSILPCLRYHVALSLGLASSLFQVVSLMFLSSK